VTNSPSDGDQANTQKRFHRTRKTARFLGTWMTPYGVLRQAHQRHVSSLALTPDTPVENPAQERVNNWASVLATLIGLGGCVWGFLWLNEDSAERSTLSIIGIFAVITTIMLLLKLRRHIANLRELHRRKTGKPASNDESTLYAPDDRKRLNADDAALAVFLFRVTTWRNAYYIGAVYALCLFLTPSNIAGIRQWRAMDGWLDMASIISLTYIFLIAILAVSGLRAQKDRRNLLAEGAQPSVEGYVTMTNNTFRIAGFAAATVTVAAVGDFLMAWIAENNVALFAAAIARTLVLIYMVAFGINILRSSSTMSGLQTARDRSEAGFWSVFLIGGCRLPPPRPNQSVEPVTPVVTLAALILFGAGLWVASNGGVAALLVVISSIGPLALLASIIQFYPAVANTADDAERTTTS
jgi:hypothetical protein